MPRSAKGAMNCSKRYRVAAASTGYEAKAKTFIELYLFTLADTGLRPEPTQPKTGLVSIASKPARISQSVISFLVYRFSMGAEKRSSWSFTQTLNGKLAYCFMGNFSANLPSPGTRFKIL